MKFACLCYLDQEKVGGFTRKDWARLDDETLDFDSELTARGVMTLGYPMQDAATGVTVRVRDGKMTATDGPFAETKEQLAGFFLIEVDSREEAVRIAAECPLAPLGWVVIRPWLEREHS
ncbi:MAG TPA: YciI family protein [Devosia sp.]|nr:YciI family protein [Devosia sp.]